MADLTTQVLIQIRDEIRELRIDLGGRIDQTNGRLDQTNERLDQTNERLGRVERRQVESELRLATEIVAVAGAMHELRDVFIQDRRLKERYDDHERRIQILERGAK